MDGKNGFSVPLQKWITDDLLEPMSDVIIDKNLIQYFGINENELKKIITEHRMELMANGQFLQSFHFLVGKIIYPHKNIIYNTKL